ncbi:MAG: hydrogenase accessory protein HypB [Verrucomicrobia bacterium]|nr:MAG: hydrogenase accessory protein HypB [Verrucomicrobiota bacterium]
MSHTHIPIYRAVMEDSTRWAEATRALLTERRQKLFNFIGSPGAGKTALLEALARALKGRVQFAVIEGDCAGTRDAERLAAEGVQAVQIVTGAGCHLPAESVHQVLRDLPATGLDFVLVENVGNLVCPAAFDIGETAKLAVLSVTEGEDKPLKYPTLFRQAAATVLTKVDLLPHLRFNLAKCRAALHQIKAAAPVFELSGKTGQGIGAFADWLLRQK